MKNQSNKASSLSPLETAARLTGCRPEEILALRVTPEGGLCVIAPSGRKLLFTREQIAAAGAPMAKPARPGKGGAA
jgi:hypothetical protein